MAIPKTENPKEAVVILEKETECHTSLPRVVSEEIMKILDETSEIQCNKTHEELHVRLEVDGSDALVTMDNTLLARCWSSQLERVMWLEGNPTNHFC